MGHTKILVKVKFMWVQNPIQILPTNNNLNIIYIAKATQKKKRKSST